MAELLPPEILTEIFKFLPLSDLRDVACVCRSWNEACTDPLLLQDVTLRLTVSRDQSTQRALERFKVTSVQFDGFTDSDISTVVKLREATCDFGTVVQTLSLRSNGVTTSHLVPLLKCFPGLKSLDLSSSNGLFYTGTLLKSDLTVCKKLLANLEELNLSCNRHLSDAILDRFFEVAPRISKLSLASCALVDSTVSGWGNGDRGSVLTCDSVLTNITSRSHYITSIDLSYTKVTHKVVSSLVKIKGLKLRDLKLKACVNITDDTLLSISRYQPTLEIVNVAHCFTLTTISISTIVEKLNNLERLDLCRLTPKTVAKNFKLTKLKKLDISESSASMPHNIASFDGTILTGCCSCLVELNLDFCTWVTEEFLLKIVDSFPALRVLTLQSCLQLKNSCMPSILTKLPHLDTLDIGWCTKITDQGLLMDTEPILLGPEMNVPGSDQCSCFVSKTDDDVQLDPITLSFRRVEQCPVTVTWPGFKSLPKLRSLHLNALSITDFGLGHTIRSNNCIKHLDLSLCAKLTDISMLVVGRYCACLETLYLNRCRKVTDVGTVYVIEHCPRISRLSLSGLGKITDRSIESMMKHSGYLRFLDVSCCLGISLAAIELLQSRIVCLDVIQANFVGDT